MTPRPVLRADRGEVVLDPVGAGLQRYVVDGVDVLDGYADDQPNEVWRGSVLAPWPNRVRGGRYTFAGREHQLDCNDTELGTALHGLVFDAVWQVERADDRHVRFAHELAPSGGYPFALSLAVDYALTAEAGLDVTLTIANAGDGDAPVGVGFHPFFAVASGSLADAELTVPADTWLRPADDGIPSDAVPVDGTPLDLRSATVVGDQQLDDAVGHLRRDGDRVAHVHLVDRSAGRRITLRLEEGLDWLMIFTGESDRIAPERRRTSIAIEPMSCPPDALRTGTDLAVLAAGTHRSWSWAVRVEPLHGSAGAPSGGDR